MSTSLWLHGRVHVELHPAVGTGGVPRGGVVLVPPFGWEAQASHRVRRIWAESIAATGFAALRVDLPGGGDSADDDPQQDALTGWRDAVGEACRLLRARTGGGSVTVLGLGLGGVPALLAAADGAADGVVLWATPTRRRSAVRALRAFAAVQGDPDRSATDGALWVNGFRLSAGTLAALTAVDLAGVDVAGSPTARCRRVLLLGRDGAAPDARLADALAGRGVAVETAPGPGWTTFVGHPMTAELPVPVRERVGTWLDADPVPSGPRSPGPGIAATPAAGTVGLVRPGVSERVVRLRTPSGALYAVVTEPDVVRDPRTLVLLNAGAVPCSGPNRLWARAARDAAAAGLTAVRLDLPGIGDSAVPGEGASVDADFYTPERTRQVGQALDAIEGAGLPARFLLSGLCSGAYWSFQLGQLDRRVEAVLLLNPMALLWHQSLPGVSFGRDLLRLRQWSSWRRLLTGHAFRDGYRARVAVLLRCLSGAKAARRAARRARQGSSRDLVAEGFAALSARGVRAMLAYSDDEPMLLEMQRGGRLERLAREQGVCVRRLGGPRASHTLAPPRLQSAALALFGELTRRPATQVAVVQAPV